MRRWIGRAAYTRGLRSICCNQLNINIFYKKISQSQLALSISAPRRQALFEGIARRRPEIIGDSRHSLWP